MLADFLCSGTKKKNRTGDRYLKPGRFFIRSVRSRSSRLWCGSIFYI